MNASDRISTDDLTDEQIEQIINTRLFQKGLAYAKLAEGIEVLREEDEIFDSMVTSILKKHSQVRSEESVREFFELFVDEIQTFTEPLVEESDDGTDAAELEDLYVEEGS